MRNLSAFDEMRREKVEMDVRANEKCKKLDSGNLI